ncbi:isocitrate lyase/phosphoenolpyruvate mutase family protein [Pseudooceanicola sp. 216_PA32_1]|uniref:Isocitrate lyase/phosphoenolpyruvate mutase family protein n=1 Tax=Pseudooceanicola pacificus TaxID=2676438 RepID=A0A844W9E8_9RHOB|nr:isocitrate lyase/phosphoenolpyruvate mutase family protein [Pseudooceanicola pacificus]MWB79524.1 isocitrate lyase/phosphoenolpyruvate mutase family protein [Pseudooceanicola pacificus]
MHDPGPAFRALHQKGNPFILCNAWDIGSAKVLAALGAQALATSSSAYAFTLGRPDGGLSRDEALAHAEDMVKATPLPVSGDFENGFGEAPETVAETIRMACDAGLAGCSIEDTALPDSTAYEFDLAVERIKAAVAAARALPRDFVLVARADGILQGSYDTDEALRRLKAFEAAGADCLYAPLPPTFEDLARICAEIEAPVNALISGTFASYTREDYARIGVARISLGGSLARATHRTLIDAAEEMLGEGDFSKLKKSAPGSQVDKMLG